MKTTELSRIEKSVLIQAPRARVWRALTDLAEFSKWFGVSSEGQIVPGARLKMTITIEGYAGMVFYLAVEKLEPMDLFSWRWHPGAVEKGLDYSKEPTTLVEFRLRDEAGGTQVTVVESGFDAISLTRRAKVFAENTEGWEFELGNLEK
ncbi:MAG: SRPBCC family protein, partial [Acidobacteria bacterium]|nr:SRPBCC family protein [Acidobacteriota bacterium]